MREYNALILAGILIALIGFFLMVLSFDISEGYIMIFPFFLIPVPPIVGIIIVIAFLLGSVLLFYSMARSTIVEFEDRRSVIEDEVLSACRVCGTALPTDANYCYHCGESLRNKNHL